MKIIKETTIVKKIEFAVTCQSGEPVVPNFGEFCAKRAQKGIETDKGLMSCFCCDKTFMSDDEAYLLFVRGHRNRLACTACAYKIRAEG